MGKLQIMKEHQVIPEFNNKMVASPGFNFIAQIDT